MRQPMTSASTGTATGSIPSACTLTVPRYVPGLASCGTRSESQKGWHVSAGTFSTGSEETWSKKRKAEWSFCSASRRASSLAGGLASFTW